jgi:coenzyme F420-reducing hydrogenase alpha subunit
MTTITISPVTRIEGHAKITLETDDSGQVIDAAFHVASFRGFEKFLEGAAIERLPALTSRICGICPVAHQLASVKAIEAAMGATPPSTAIKLRELLLMGQYLASHIVSLGLLSLPDLLLPGASPEKRNLTGLMAKGAPVVADIMALRQLGARFFSAVGGRETHTCTPVIGGMSRGLGEKERDALLRELEGGERALHQLVDAIRYLLGKEKHVGRLGGEPSPHLGLTRGGSLEFYHGQLGLMDKGGQGRVLGESSIYFDHVQEDVQQGSYMKYPRLRDGRWFRVGPLARLNVNERIDTPWAQAELETYRQAYGRPAHATLLYHYARTIETVYAWERARELLSDPEITGQEMWIPLQAQAGSGIGAIEAPRGTLVHRYAIDEQGYATGINLVVATVHNNHAINRTLRAVAPQTIHGEAPEAALNQLEMIVRAYDPCLSCATH